MKTKFLKFVSANHQKCILISLSRFHRLVSYKNDVGEICVLRFIFVDVDDNEYKIEIHDDCARIQNSFEFFLSSDYIIFNCVCNFQNF